MSLCIYCGAPAGGSVYRNTLCSSCGKELHTCRNCLRYSPGQPYDCAEHIHEPIADKDRANFCDSFQMNTLTELPSPAKSVGKSSRDAFDALFGE